MRILALITEAFGGYGGIALYNRDLLTALCDHHSCSKVVAVPRLMPNPLGPLPSKLDYITDGLNDKTRFIITALKTIGRYPKFDLIICGHINLLPLAYFIHRWLNRPLLLFIYGVDAWQPTQSRISNYLVSKIESYVSISEVTQKKFLNWAKLDQTKGFILPNAIHTENFGPGAKNRNLLDRYHLHGKTILMTMGRIASEEQYKGFDEVLDLLPELIGDIPDVIYVIAGDGSDKERLEQKAKSLGIEKQVIFTGFIPESEKADHYRLADAYVMPSTGEGFGFVFLEAMACGIPVVGSKVDGGREALRNGELGILVNPDSQEEIKTGILDALKRPKGVIPKGFDYFSFPNFEKRLYRIIDAVMHEQGKGNFGNA